MTARATRRRLLAGAAGIALLAGLGASPVASALTPSTPSVRPVENITPFVGRFTRSVGALQAGDCATWTQFTRQTTYPFACDDFSRALFANFGVLRYRQFGTGALVEYAAGETPLVNTAVLLLRPDHRFGASRMGVRVLAGGTRGTLGTRPTAGMLRLFDRTAGLFVESVRARNCDLFFRVAVTVGQTKAQACHSVLGNRVIAVAYAGDPDAAPVRIGGTAEFQFYRLRQRTGHYQTLVVGRIGRPGGLYLADAVRVY